MGYWLVLPQLSPGRGSDPRDGVFPNVCLAIVCMMSVMDVNHWNGGILQCRESGA